MRFINGTIYYGGKLQRKDFAVINRKVTFENLTEANKVIDLDGLIVSPGFVDVHIHTRVPGFEHKEDLNHITQALLFGGFTHAVAQSNTNPKPDNVQTLSEIQEMMDESKVNIIQAGRITKDNKVIDIKELSKQTRLFTDDGEPVEVEEEMLKAIKLAKETDSVLILHEQDNEIKGNMYHCSLSKEKDIQAFDETYETNIVERDIRLNKEVNAKLHFQHISAAGSIEAVRRARENGMPVTAELTPHHMSLDNEMIINDGKFKMNPPLPKPETRQKLIQGLKDKVITIIATDHAPHTEEDKSGGFENSVNGIIGLESSFAVSHTTAINNNIPLETIINAMSINPGKLMGVDMNIEEGKIANLTIIDPNERWIFTKGDIQSKSMNTPFIGKELIGKVKQIIINGEHIVLEGVM